MGSCMPLIFNSMSATEEELESYELVDSVMSSLIVSRSWVGLLELGKRIWDSSDDTGCSVSPYCALAKVSSDKFVNRGSEGEVSGADNTVLLVTSKDGGSSWIDGRGCNDSDDKT